MLSHSKHGKTEVKVVCQCLPAWKSQVRAKFNPWGPGQVQAGPELLICVFAMGCLPLPILRHQVRMGCRCRQSPMRVQCGHCIGYKTGKMRSPKLGKRDRADMGHHAQWEIGPVYEGRRGQDGSDQSNGWANALCKSCGVD